MPIWVVEASLAGIGNVPDLAVMVSGGSDTRPVGGSIRPCNWDNRLTNGPGVSSIVYDADGNRIKKVAGSTTTWYLVATVNPTGYPQVVEEFTGSTPGTNTLSRVYGYGLDLLHQRQMPGNTPNFYGYDGQGSVRFLANSSGAITDTYVYDSYGNLITGSSSIVNPNAYRYTGEQWDADLGMYYLRARYYQPSVGRFWTRDTYEGNQSDPLSLHRYLYTQGNPINGVDPSGENTEAISTLTTVGIGAGLAGFGVLAAAEAKNHAIGNLMVATWDETLAGSGSLADAAESALSVARTSVRDLLKKAKAILKQSGQMLLQVKVVPVPRSVIPNIANHVVAAQASGQPMILTRVLPAVARANRRAAVALRGPAGIGMSWDEYPFASGRPPGMFLPPSVVAVPWLENSIQGGIISACYRLENIAVGSPYIVVVIP